MNLRDLTKPNYKNYREDMLYSIGSFTITETEIDFVWNKELLN